MSDLSFSFVDVLVVATIVLSAAYAVYRGFVAETLSIFAWAAAAFATLWFGPAVAAFLHVRMSPHWLGGLLGYAGVFLVVCIPLSFISYRFAQGVKHSPVGTLDRSLGLAFGIVRGFAIIGFVYFVFSSFVPVREQPSWMTQARTLGLIQGSSEVLLSLVPERNAPATIEAERKSGEIAVSRDETGGSRTHIRKHKQKIYGASERRALDRLIEATGDGGDGKP